MLQLQATTQFRKDDFYNLSEILDKIKGKFLLSLNDTKETREIFSKFDISAVTTSYSLSKSNKQNIVELFIKNY